MVAETDCLLLMWTSWILEVFSNKQTTIPVRPERSRETFLGEVWLNKLSNSVTVQLKHTGYISVNEILGLSCGSVQVKDSRQTLQRKLSSQSHHCMIGGSSLQAAGNICR